MMTLEDYFDRFEKSLLYENDSWVEKRKYKSKLIIKIVLLSLILKHFYMRGRKTYYIKNCHKNAENNLEGIMFEFISKKIGGAWWRLKNNITYISCQINIEGKEYNISLFENTYKKNENQPDFNVLLNEKR